MVNNYDILGLVPTYLLPPIQHLLREAQGRPRAQDLHYSHPDSTAESNIFRDSSSSSSASTGTGTGSPPDPLATDKDKASGSHARIDSIASAASATTVASVSSTVSRAYSSASSASVTDSELSFFTSPPPATQLPLPPSHGAPPPALQDTSVRSEGPLFRIPSYADTDSAAAKGTACAQHATSSPHSLRRMHPTTLRCRQCATDFAFTSQIISKGFTARNGRGLLVSPPPTNADHLMCPSYDSEPDDSMADEAAFVNAAHARFDQRSRARRDEYRRRLRCNNLPNVAVGSFQYSSLTTGHHVIAKIICCGCSQEIGWKYLDAREPSQKYKIGNFILEANKVAEFSSWEHVDDATIRAIDGALSQDPGSQSASASASAPALASVLRGSTAAAHDDSGLDDPETADSNDNTDTDTSDDDDDDEAAPGAASSSEPRPRPSLFWAARSARAVSLANADPMASARAFAARLHHENTMSAGPYQLIPPSSSVSASDRIQRELFEAEVVDTIRYRVQQHEDPIVFGLQQRMQLHQRSLGLRARDGDAENQAYQAHVARERRNEIPPPEIEFDSQDEDECDELFAGTWDARTVAARRAAKAAAAAAEEAARAAKPRMPFTPR